MAMIRALPGRQERDSYENGRKRGPSLEQRLSAHAMTAACHDRVDTFDSALMGHSLALQRSMKSSFRTALRVGKRIAFSRLTGIAEGGKRAAMIKAQKSGGRQHI